MHCLHTCQMSPFLDFCCLFPVIHNRCKNVVLVCLDNLCFLAPFLLNRPDFSLNKFIGKMLYFSAKKGIIHSHRDLNSVLSSTDKTNLLGPIPSRLRSPAPRVRTRAAVSSVGGNTSLSLKPAARVFVYY